MQFSAFVPFLQATGECERAAFVPAVASAWWGKPTLRRWFYIQDSGVGVCKRGMICVAVHVNSGRAARTPPRSSPAGGGGRTVQFSAFVPFCRQREGESAAFVPAVASGRWGKPHPTTMVYIQDSGVGVCIAIHRKPHTVLRRLTGHPKKWLRHFLGKPAPYNRVLSSAARLV